MEKGIRTELSKKDTKASLRVDEVENEGSEFKGEFSYDQCLKNSGLDLPSREVLGSKIALVLEQIVNSNRDKKKKPGIFDSKKIPRIGVKHYLERIVKYSRVSLETLVYSVILVDRYIENQDEYLINEFNVHKVFFVALVLSSKFHEDLRLANKDFAKIGGISKGELLILEMNFLRIVKFELKINPDTFIGYLRNILDN